MDCEHEKIVGTHDKVRCCRCNAEWDRHELLSMPGPGTTLKGLIQSIARVKPCSHCEGRIIQMNLWGAEGCRRRLPILVKWMRSEIQRAVGRGELDEHITAMVDMAIQEELTTC